MNQNNFLRGARIFTVLLAGFFLIPALRAQPTEQTVQSRFLFIFDTSSAMKSRVDAVQKALNTMLATSLSGQMHAGDSMGVWTFNQDLRPGDFPLQTWDPDDAVKIAANFTKFVGDQHYAKSGRFAALQPLLNRVMLGSERLTVVIFCDGETPISGTPFDAGINQAFQEKLAKQKSARQPFVIVLRSQLGQYVNCTMGFSPQPATFSEFPPLPEPPPPPAPKLTNAPPPVQAPVVPSLIIVGTKIQSSPPLPQTSPRNSPPVTNQPPATEPAAPPVVPIQQTTGPAASSATPTPTNATAQTVMQTNSTRPTNAPVSLTKISSSGNKNFLIGGAALLGAAIALMIVLWLRSNRKFPSLITRSMNDRR
jgi:hypothetical protein